MENIDRHRYAGLGNTLLSAWKDVRNKVMHSDLMDPPPHRRLVDAENDVGTLNRAMCRGHEYLVERGIIRSSPNSTTSALRSPFQQDERKQVEPGEGKSEAKVQETFSGVARIGTDESGKGDYFGPLVIGAVFVDSHVEAKLAALGVRDSKKLSASRIQELAEEIKLLCPFYSIVAIGPKRYNELYEEMGNLNRLLAWGHARALENVLGKTPCELAIADQFGDQAFLLNALLTQGRQITLEQRPRAEEDIAVAAASILARAEWDCPDFVEGRKSQVTAGICSNAIGE